MNASRVVLNHRTMLATALAVAGLLQFVSCVTMAAGSSQDFEFGQDFLSTLGTTENATITMIGYRGHTVFNTSVVLLGSCLILFFALAFDLNGDTTPGQLIFQSAGVCSAIGLIGIGLTPFDEFLLAHNLCLAVWLIPMVVMVFAGIPVMGVGELSHGVALLAAVAVMAATAFFAMTILTENAPAMQAVVILAACLWLLLMCCHVLRVAVCLVTGIRHGNDRATRQYLQLLESGQTDNLFDRSAGRWDPRESRDDHG